MAKKATAKKTTDKEPAKKAAAKKTSASKTSSKAAVPAKKVVESKPAEQASAKGAGSAQKSPAKVSKKATSRKSGDVTKVVAKVDVGWGNSLYIRGEGSGLSWDEGVLMSCESGNEWAWLGKGTITFKVLINDEIWASGEDVEVTSGKTYTFTPTF